VTDLYECARLDAVGLRAMIAARGREDLLLETAMTWHEQEPSIFVG